MRNRIIAIVVTLLLGISAVAARAQALADRVPADAILYVGWTGTEAQTDACKASNFQAILDHSDIPTFINDTLPQILVKIGMDAPEALDAVKLVAEIVPPLWHHPTAIYFAGMSPHGQPKFALLCQAGADSQQLADGLTDAFKMAQIPMSPTVARVGDVVVMEMGYPSAADAAVAAGAGSLSLDSGFKADMAQVDPQGMIVGYLNTVKLFDFVGSIPGLPAQVKTGLPKALAGLGLDGLKSAAFSEGFDGKSWGGKFFAAAPAPRTGLLKLIEAPVDDSLLKIVPPTSTSVAISRLDLAGAVGVIRTAAAGVDPQLGHMIDGYISQANQFTGVDLQNDFLGSFGPDWVAYSDPQTAGAGGLGTVFANRPRNADKLAASLGTLETLANTTVANLIHDRRFHLEFKTTTIDGTEIHYLATPFLTPAWAIKDGVWYAALYPSVVSSAIDNTSAGKSILDNPDFMAMRTRLAPPGNLPVSEFHYVDLRATAPLAYPGLLAMSRIVGVTDIFGVDSPLMMIPTYRQLAPQLAPMGGVSWSDADGFHSRHVEPFVGSDLLAIDPSLASSLQSDFMMMGFWGATMNRHGRF